MSWMNNIPVETGLIVRPRFGTPDAESENKIGIKVQACTPEGTPIHAKVCFDLRVSATYSAFDEYQTGVLGAAHASATIAVASPALDTTVVRGSGTATATVLTNQFGYADVDVTYTSAEAVYIGAGSALFGSTVIVGDQVAQLNFA